MMQKSLVYSRVVTVSKCGRGRGGGEGWWCRGERWGLKTHRIENAMTSLGHHIIVISTRCMACW